MTPEKTKKITILGIGNILYSDEGIGVHTLPKLEELLQEKLSPNELEIIEGATDGMRLLEPVEDTEYLIIIDAINAGKEPGTLITIENDEVPKYFGVKMSTHQVGFQEVLFAAKIRERLPKEMVMFGIQPASLEWGIGLTEVVQQQVDKLANAVCERVDKWCAAHE